MPKTILRITTVSMAFKVLLNGQMKFMQKQGFTVIMASADGVEREDIIKNEECPHMIIGMTRKVTPFRDMVSLWKLWRIMRRYHPDIVHTHTLKAGLLGMLAARLACVRVRLHTVAGLQLLVEKGFKKRILLLTERVTYACASEVWPNSFSMKEFIINKGLVKKNKVRVIGKGSSNGVDLKQFSIDQLDETVKKRIAETIKVGDKIKILFVGRMVKDKGVEELVEAFKILVESYPIHLILIGPFEKHLDPLSRNVMDEISGNPKIHHIPWSDEIPYYMSLADILVHPSHREGFPNVILQAGAMKLPVVCSDIPGNTDIVKQGETAFVFEKRNEVELVKTLRAAIENREIRNTVATNLHNKVLQHYDREKVQQLILENYNSLLALS